MTIKTLSVGSFSTNCYIVNDEEGRTAIIDPGADNATIEDYIKEYSLTPECVILTHGHLDHFLAAESVAKAFSVPIIAHEAEFDVLQDGNSNGTVTFAHKAKIITPDKLVSDGENIKIGSIVLKVIHTPGHTRGSMCLFCDADNVLFSGDTLFFESIGRADLPTGNYEQLVESVKKIYSLCDGCVVYPGHGPETRVSYEMENNPYVSE